MATSVSISGKQVTQSWSYGGPTTVANLGGGAATYTFDHIVIGCYGQSTTQYVYAGSYTWTHVPYSTTFNYSAQPWYTRSGGSYQLANDSGSATTDAAPAPSTPPTPNLSGSGSPGYVSFSWSGSASGYEWSGAFGGSGASTSVGGAAASGSTQTLSVRAYNVGDGVNTVGTTYSNYANLGVYVPYPAPSAPSTPSVSGSVSGTSAVFSWGSVGSSGYSVYVNGAFYTNTSSTSVTVASSAGSTVSCFVQAYNTNPDGVKANSASSNTATVTIPLPPPAAPSTPTLSSSVSGTTITVSWSNVGATGYQVYRDGSFLGSTSSLSYADAGRTKGVTYNYVVRAYNSDANGTSYAADSTALSVRIPNPPAAPSATSLTATAHTNGDGTVDLSWTSVGATGYRVSRNGVQISDTSALSLSNTGNARGASISYVVVSYNTNADGTTLGQSSNTVTVTIPDLPAAPSAPTLSTSASAVAGTITLTWTNVSAGTYQVFRDTALIATITNGSVTYVDSPTVASHDYYVVAFNTNTVGNSSNAQSNTSTITLPPMPVPDPPPAPTISFVSVTNSNTSPNYYGVVTVTWSTSSGATQYRLFRDGTLIYQGTGTTATDSGSALTIGSSHDYYVVPSATNASGTATGSASATISATIPAPPPPPAPATPGSVTTSASSKYQQVTVTWTLPGATGYRVYRDGVLAATSTVGTFTEARPAETYTTYYVVAYNAATNPGGTTESVGPQSNSVTVLTKAVPPNSVGTLIG